MCKGKRADKIEVPPLHFPEEGVFTSKVCFVRYVREIYVCLI